MKKALVILLCALAVFAIVSCKNEPKPEPEPAPSKPVVTFDTKGGSEIAAVTVEKDAKVEKPADPTKADSYFYSWFTDAEFTNEYNFEAPVTQSITLYAKWIPVPATEAQIYKIVAGAEGDRFQYQWIFTDAIKEGDVISFKYKSNRVLNSYTVRPMTAKDADDGKLASSVAIENPAADEDGWYTFTFTVPAAKMDSSALSSADKGIGVALYFAPLTIEEVTYKKARVGVDYIYIKDVTYKTATETKTLTMDDDSVYYGAEGKVTKEYAYRLEATDGTDGVDSEKYDRDKFRLKFTDSPTVKEGDVFSITFKAVRTDEMTAERVFNKFNIRDKGKWIYEQDSTAWTTYVTDEETGWTTATYKFAATYYDSSAVTYPATFYVDIIDSKMASPKEGRIPDVLYIQSITLTTVDPEDPEKTITTNLTLDEAATSAGYVCPIIKKY